MIILKTENNRFTLSQPFYILRLQTFGPYYICSAAPSASCSPVNKPHYSRRNDEKPRNRVLRRTAPFLIPTAGAQCAFFISACSIPPVIISSHGVTANDSFASSRDVNDIASEVLSRARRYKSRGQSSPANSSFASTAVHLVNVRSRSIACPDDIESLEERKRTHKQL